VSGEFELFIGIDYSGAGAPTSRVKALQVYAAKPGEPPEKQFSPVPSNNNKPWNWTRAEIAAHLTELARQGVRYVAGVDHGFSFPVSYFDRYRLKSWPEFLDDFVSLLADGRRSRLRGLRARRCARAQGWAAARRARRPAQRVSAV